VNVGVTGAAATLTVGSLTNPAGTTPTVNVSNANSLLRLNGTGSPAFTGTVNVDTGGKLDGRGGVGGPVNLNSGGTIQGGNGTAAAADVLTLAGGLQLDGANTLRVAWTDTTLGNGAAGLVHSQIALGSGQLSRNTGGAGSDLTTIRLVNTGQLEIGVSYTVVVATYGSTANLVQTDFTIGAPEGFGFDGTPLVTLSPTQLTVTFVPVPEPAAVLGVAGLGLAAGWAARRRRPWSL
jgi:hypothetical protein